MTAALQFVDVHKSFSGHAVLDGVSLQVAPGEAVGLVGVNGAGKTTLIRGLLDLNRIDRGEILIFDSPHTATRARERLCYLAERFVPPHFATGDDLLRHLCALQDVTYDRARAEHEAHALDLELQALDRPAHTYSKGMAQKLGLIACVLPERPLLALDEPMSGLDPKARALFKRRLTALQESGAALFFSTHLLVDVEQLCDRIAVLDRGRIQYHGPPADLIASFAAATLEEAYLRCLEAA